MNHALLQLAWDADGSGPPPSSPATDTAFWAAHAQRRVDVLAERIAARTAIAVHFPPALRMPTSLDVCDVTGAPTAEDRLQSDMDRRDLWRLALEVPPWRGPFTPGLMRLLLWATTDGDRERLPVLRPLEREILSVWIAHPANVGAALIEIVGVNGPTPAAPVRARYALDAIEALTWGVVECEIYSAAVAAGLVPRVWRPNPIPTRLAGEPSSPGPR